MKIIAIAALLFAASFSYGQTVTQSFDGDIGVGGTVSDHPNMPMASNGAYEMACTYQVCDIYTTTGTLISSTPKATFLTNAGIIGASGGGEMRVRYDKFVGSGRWMVATAAQPDYLIVSSSSDPTTSTWKSVKLTTNAGDLLMQLGYDKNWVYASEYISCSGANNSQEIAIPSADVAWTGAGTISLAHEVIDSCHTFDAIPEEDLNPSKAVTDPGYFVSRVGENQQGHNVALTLAIDTFTPTTATAGTFSAAASPTSVSTGYLFNTPIDPAQPGSPGGIRGIESHRPFSFTTTNGSTIQLLWTSGPCTSSCGAQGVNTQQLFFWFKVNIPALTMADKAVLSSSTLGFLFPSMAIDGAGDTIFTATGTSTTQFPSIYSWTHLASDGAGVINGPTLVKAGTANYQVCTSTPHPGWGDYATSAQDGLDSSKIWAVEEYANSATPCIWYTHIVQYQIAAPPPPTLVSIAVTPANPTVNVPSSTQLTATGTYSDSHTANLTAVGGTVWTSGTPGTVTLGPLTTTEQANCSVGNGSSVVTATNSSVSGNTTVTCVVPPLPPQTVVGGIPGTTQWGVSAGAVLSLSQTVTFANTNVGSTSPTQTATLTNIGTATAHISSIVINSGPNPGDFAITANSCSTVLLGGANCILTLSFTPAASGTRSARLTPISDALVNLPATLTGLGLAASQPDSALAPNTVSFADTRIGASTLLSSALTLTSNGSSTLTISSITITGTNAGDFSDTTTCGGSLAPAATCTISLTFTPTSTGLRSAQVNIISNGLHTPNVSTISGNGVSPIATLTASLAFPDTATGAVSAPLNSVLSNTGTSVLNISGITITGTNAADFSKTTTCGTTLAVGGSCNIAVTFTPTVVAPPTETAQINVADDAAGSPQTTTLSGNGLAPLVGLTIQTTSPLADCVVSQVCTIPISVTGGTPAYAFSTTAGAYPTGMNPITPTAGVVAGTPTTAGVYTFTIQVCDTTPTCVSRPFSLTIDPAVTGAADNRYCLTSELTSYPGGVTTDNGIPLPINCVYTALAGTPSSGPVTTIAAGDATGFQSALTTPVCGQTIVLTAGSVYTGSFVIPANTCDEAHWITVTTSGLAALPPEGNRVTPCYAGVSLPSRPFTCTGQPNSMAKIKSSGSLDEAVHFNAGASHIRFIGIEIEAKNVAAGQQSQNIILMAGSTAATGTVTITGAEQSHGGCGGTCYDQGTVMVIVNGNTYTYVYGATDTPTTITAGLAATINSAGAFAATATVGVLGLSSSTCNCALSTAVTFDNGNFSVPSFAATRSGATLTGGLFQNHIIFDRVWIHGIPNSCSVRAAYMGDGTSYVALIDSSVTDIHMINNACNGNDSQIFQGGFGNLPKMAFKGVDNYVESAGTNSMSFGGGGATVNPTDVEWRRNYQYKPMIWDPACANGYPSCKLPNGTPVVYDGLGPYCVKNILEFKNVIRALIEGNYMENNWMHVDQAAFAILLTPKNQSGNQCPLCVERNIVIRYNHIRTAGGFAQISNAGADDGGLATEGSHYSIHDNLSDNLNYQGVTNVGFNLNPYGVQETGVNSLTAGNSFLPNTWMLFHNTFVATNPYVAMQLMDGPVGAIEAGMVFRDNIATYGQQGVNQTSNTGCAGPTSNQFLTKYNNCWTAGYVHTKNVIIGGGSGFPGTWPVANFLPANPAAVGFVNYNNGANGDYRLCTGVNLPAAPCSGASLYHNAATDGKDVGADINAVNAYTVGVSPYN